MVPEHNEGSIGMSVAPSSFHPPQPTPLRKEDKDTPALSELEASQGFTLAPPSHSNPPKFSIRVRTSTRGPSRAWLSAR